MNAAPTKPSLRTAEAEPSSPIRTRLSAPNATHTTFRFRDTASYSANKRFAAPADSEPRELIRGRTMRRNEIVTQEARAQPTGVELIAVLVAIADRRPLAMTIEDGRALPSGPFEVGHRSLQSGLRAWVERQTGHPLGYVEQLYTFADSDRHVAADGARAISISYLGLMREERAAVSVASWRPWYDYFPWEDHRAGAPPIMRRRSRRASCAGSKREAKRLGGHAPPSPSASTDGAGTRTSSSSATSFSTRRD